MAHVGRQRLGSSDGQEHGAQDQQAEHAVMQHEGHGMRGHECRKDRRVISDVQQADCGHRREPDQTDWPEQLRHGGGAARLHGEQSDQDYHRDQQDAAFAEALFKPWNGAQAFDCGEDRERRGQRGIAIE